MKKFKTSLINSEEPALTDVFLRNGCSLYGKRPSISAWAYVHAIYEPKNDFSNYFEKKLGVIVPKALEEFYSICNGCSLGLGELDFFGFQSAFTRDPDITVTQPLDIFHVNAEYDTYSKVNKVIFGSIRKTGELLTAGLGGAAVVAIDRNNFSATRQWVSLDACIEEFLGSKCWTPDGVSSLSRTSFIM